MLQSVPHQIVQSPARLGLTNPNSPSLQNPAAPKLTSQAPQFQHSHQQSSSATTTTTSSTLLSLLPPLSRAQSLLLQMASLASKLFEVSPRRSQWLTSVRGSLPTFLSSQTPSLIPGSLESSPSTTKEILSLFTTLQTQLFEAVAELQEILDLRDAKQKVAQEIRAKDSAILSFANKLKEAERVLDILVDDYSDYRRPKRSKSEDDTESSSSCTTTVASQMNLSDILCCAHRISYTTFAPPEFGAGQAPLRGALPPAPQEEQMRASQLYNFADLDVGLPRTVDSKEKTIEALIEAPAAPPAEPNPLANLAAIQGLIPPNIMVPSGWKPGMPVELPTDLPILPPPGWKPGDPVPLPPLDSLPVPPRAEEQQLRPIAAQVLPKAPEPIHVPHVQLDITMDQDDDSSDYSSDVASSEDD
ncbi:mediator of RNA polymerase II transcription subunit 4 [Malania oleifera]|uniref:mediator of RNA polymerase II transcription subunit 4 n=1 Tax=Malania oleifera TaxID=397392 RepID=UPI0025AE9051|nr:mediator of RNA polymerase II transcription subunit 4 [Malania oleifera]XP_057983664.1 mediator of RNA polymerase II transcription subunit 4 [Malania oleifera]